VSDEVLVPDARADVDEVFAVDEALVPDEMSSKRSGTRMR